MSDIPEFLSDTKARDRALKWLSENTKSIEGLAGHEPDAERKTIPKAFIAAKLLADLYTDLRKETSEKDAQRALVSSFLLISLFLRMNGEDVRLEANPVFRPLKALPPEADLPTPTPANACSCALDQDGKCDLCWGRLYRFWKAAGQTVEIMSEAGKENALLCKHCTKRHLDASLAQFITRDLSKVELRMAEAAMQTMIASSQALSKLPMPLTTMAWNKLVEGKATL
jgi:hypothetical protein